MSFFKIQRLITLCARLAYFCILFFALRTVRIPALPFLSPDGSAALYALVLIIPLGHASSFWFMTVSTLSVIASVCAACELLIRRFSFYPYWRTLVLHGYAPFLLCFLYLLWGLAQAKFIRKKRYTITTRHPLPSRRLRIVHMADMHPWRLQTKWELGRIYAMIDEEKPDLMMLTGDIFDENTTPKMFRRYLRLFAALHPKYGIYFVFGNHDAYSRWKVPSHTRDDILREFASVGIRILEDETILTADGLIRIAGRRDLDEERMTPEELLSSGQLFSGFTVLLCHEPVEFSQCADAGADLILAGHTHGGQIFPLGIITHRLLKIHDGNTGKIPLSRGAHAIITSGVSTWSYPIRTESQSEIVIIDILQE
ncbi:MAG: metallophosphoesterase [Clostridia bacterium]|nr:metallophosphoesterase [Clostridia bacterium]